MSVHKSIIAVTSLPKMSGDNNDDASTRNDGFSVTMKMLEIDFKYTGQLKEYITKKLTEVIERREGRDTFTGDVDDTSSLFTLSIIQVVLNENGLKALGRIEELKSYRGNVYRVEFTFVDNPPPDSIGAVAKKRYMDRLELKHYFSYNCIVDTFESHLRTFKAKLDKDLEMDIFGFDEEDLRCEPAWELFERYVWRKGFMVTEKFTTMITMRVLPNVANDALLTFMKKKGLMGGEVKICEYFEEVN